MTIMPDWMSWIARFVIFFTLAKWSGLKWQWAVGLTFGIECWEMLDWSQNYLIEWWLKPDTWLDILFGCAAVWIVKKRWL